MIKKIPVNKVKVGVYVHNLDCSWMQHPFTVNQFKITHKDQINKIEKSGIKEFYIDTEKGCDVDDNPTAENMEVDPDPESISINISSKTQTTSLTNELVRAVKVKEEAIQAVSNIMKDARLGKLVNLNHIESLIENVVSLVLCNKDALLGFMRIRELDKYTFEHAVSASILLVAFGESLALSDDELMQIGIGGLLMDIGKSLIPQEILRKPGELSDDEFGIMRKHVVYGKGLVEQTPNTSEVVMNIISEHHERIDGSGYPAGMQGDDISLYGQMAAIVDVYDALSVNRVYCTGSSPNAALKKLVTSGTEFNQELVQKFIHCIGIYPVGSLVALSNGLFAVVIKSGSKGLLYPAIRIVFDSTKRQFITPQDIDLSDQEEKESVKIVGAVEPDKWRINPADFMEHAKFS